MENRGKVKDKFQISRLRADTMSKLLANANQEGFSEHHIQLFKSLLPDFESRIIVFTFIQVVHPLPLLNSIMNLLYDFFAERNDPLINRISNSNTEENSDIESQNQSIFSCLFECVNRQLPSSNTKVDIHILSFLDSISRLASLFPNEIKKYTINIPSNQNQISFLFLVMSYLEDVSEYFQFIQSAISAKAPLSSFTFSILILLSKHQEIENGPSVKTLISFYKSISENEITFYVTPTILSIIGHRLQSNMLKEIPSFITYLLKKTRKGTDHTPNLCEFIDKFLQFQDSASLLKPVHEDLLFFFISNVQSPSIELQDNIIDSREYGYDYIIDLFLNFIQKSNLSPFEFLSQTRDTSVGTMILAYAAANTYESYKEVNETESQDAPPIRKFDLNEIESFLDPLIQQTKQFKSNSYQFLIRLCGICAKKFESKISLNFLVSALSKGSQVAYDLIIDPHISFDFIFPGIIDSFKPGRIDGLYVSALQSLLQDNLPSIPDLPTLTMMTKTQSSSNFETDSTMSDTLESAPELIQLTSNHIEKNENEENPNEEVVLHGTPTTTTKLFCTVIAFVSDFPELMPLLGPSASTISKQFSLDLISDIQQSSLNSRNSTFELLVAFSKSIRSLDLETIHSLALTFQLLLPGKSILFLSITLQRLPQQFILNCLQKLVQFAHPYPDTFGKAIALISSSYPELALSFTEAFITNSITKRRVFFIFKSTEISDDTLIVVFRIIEHCSLYIDINYFITDFLTFAQSFMGKHLLTRPKNIEVIQSSLYAIKKMCSRLLQYQNDEEEHSFAFKEFLETYLNSVLRSQVSKLKKIANDGTDEEKDGHNPWDYLILQAYASVIPLRPIRNIERYTNTLNNTEKLIQYTREKYLSSLLKSVQKFYVNINFSNQSFDTFVAVSQSLFGLLLRHQKWQSICEVIHSIYTQFEAVKMTASQNELSQSISNINLLISNAVPLSTDKQYGNYIYDIIFNLTELLCTLRNQALQETRMQLPAKQDLNDCENGEQQCRTVCSFLSQHLVVSQIFEIISLLLKTFQDKSILVEHHEGIALTIKFLIEMKGSDEFRYDRTIIQDLIAASEGKDEKIVSLFIDSIEIISTIRMYSVISILVNSTEIPNPLFERIITTLMPNKQSVNRLVPYLVEHIESNPNSEDEEKVKQNYIKFAEKVIPLLSQILLEIDNESWAHLFVTILKITQSIDTPFFKSLFHSTNNELDIEDNMADYQDLRKDLKELYRYAKEASLDHPLSLPLILSYFPEKPTPFFRKISLSIALFSPETCQAFLKFVLKDIMTWDDADMDILSQIFSSIDGSIWSCLAEPLITLVINFMDTNSSDNIKYILSFLKNAEDEARLLMWKSLISSSMTKIKNNIKILLAIFEKVPIDIPSIIPIIPLLSVESLKNQDAVTLVKIIYEQIEGNQFDDENQNANYSLLLFESAKLKKHHKAFLDKFVEMLNHDESIDECITCMSSIINQANNDTRPAIEALILQLPKVKEQYQMKIAAMIQNVLT